VKFQTFSCCKINDLQTKKSSKFELKNKISSAKMAMNSQHTCQDSQNLLNKTFILWFCTHFIGCAHMEEIMHLGIKFMAQT
jgi:hypothetical protein